MAYLLVIAVTFGVMFLLDKGLTKLFRSQNQHRSGTAVRLKKHFGLLSLALMALVELAEKKCMPYRHLDQKKQEETP